MVNYAHRSIPERRDPHVPSRAIRLGVLALLAAVGVAHGQTQFQERLPRQYLPADLDFTNSLGVADLDGDGDLDLLAANGIPTRLYRNQGQGVFDDVSATGLPPSLASVYAYEVVVGDLDQDGDADAVLGSSLGSSPAGALLLNDGGASFGDGSLGLPSTFRNISDLALGDADGNGTIDVIASKSDVFQSAGVYLGDGQGTFTDASAQNMPANNTGPTRAVDVGDVDGDGDLDLALAASGSSERIYENDGLGAFTYSFSHFPNPRTDFSTDLELVDLNLDGDLDLAVAATSGRNVLYQNDGAGVFTDVSSLLPPDVDSSTSVAAGDLDGDAFPDLVFGNYGLSRVYQNDGTGAFAAWSQPRIEAQLTYEAVLADVDLDGDLDLFLGNWGQDHLLVNDGGGTLFDATPEGFPWSRFDRGAAFELVDVDEDGDQDLIAAGGLYRVTDGGSQNYLFRAERPGEFSEGERLGPAFTNTVALAAGDVDGDADSDVVLANALLCGLGYVGFNCEPQPNRLLVNDGGGAFAEEPGRLPSDADDTFAVVLGDVDGDLDLDLITGNWQQQSRLYRNDGTGFFDDVTAGRLPARADRTRALVLADMDDDVDLDIVVGNEGQQDRQYVNEGAGAFFDGTAIRMPADARKTRALAVLDVDADGDLDLVLARDGQPGLYRNDGTGKLLDRSDRFPVLPDEAWAIRVGDLDEDGFADVLLGCRSAAGGPARDRLLLNDGSGRFVDVSATRLPADVERTATLELADVDGDGDLDVFAGTTGTTNGLWPYVSHFYLNLHRQLEAPLLPVIGRTYELELHAQPGYAAVPHMALVGLSLGLLPDPQTDPTMGTLYLAEPIVLFPTVAVPSPQGSLVFGIGIPPAPGLYGLTFYAQGGIYEQGVLRLTGYLEEVFWR